MRKSSRSISLALIGSALMLGGCQPAAEESEWSDDDDLTQVDATTQGVATGNDQYNQNHGGAGRAASRIGGAMIGSQIGRSIGGAMRPGPNYGGGGGGGMASPSARGGFGSSAGSSGGFSASS